MEAEMRVMQPQAKECRRLPGTARSWEEARKGLSLEPSERIWPCPHLVLGLLASGAVGG